MNTNPPTGPWHAANAHTRRQALRWERLWTSIRCGLQPGQPAMLRTYIGLGRWLVQQGQLDDRQMQQRTLRLLLLTAADEALPWFWRSVCLEHADRPLARLTALLSPLDPVGTQRWHSALALAREQLPLVARRD